jgi:cysteinyl-tRNA synthetase
MSFNSSTLLWIAVVVLVIAVAYLAWRLWIAGRGASPAATTAEPAPPRQMPAPSAAPERRGSPPPAWAGQASATGGPGTMAPKTSHAAPPASAGGGRPSAANADGYGPPRPRSSKPPPVLAGNVPGQALPVGAPAARPRASRPPAASAGGADGGRKSSDPDPSTPVPRPSRKTPAIGKPSSALAQAQSWGYQLQHLDLDTAAASAFDLLVIDYARDGTDATALTPADLARLKRRDDGRERLVYAYLSIGEAESYRFYWQDAWKESPPEWLLSENPEWKENFAVAYWEPGWQSVLFGGAGAYVDRIAKAGFDGVYLDKCDVHEDLERREKKIAKAHGDLEGDMVRLIARLSAYVRSKHPGLGIIMQNAEHLLGRAEVRACIDAAAKEELLYGQAGGTRRNAKGDIAEARDALQLLQRDGKAVFVVEYLDDATRAAEATAEVRELGFVPYVSRQDRELATLEPQDALVG